MGISYNKSYGGTIQLQKLYLYLQIGQFGWGHCRIGPCSSHNTTTHTKLQFHSSKKKAVGGFTLSILSIAEYVLYLSRLFRQYSLHFMATLNNKPVILNPRREVIVTHLHNHTCKKCLAMFSPTFKEGENFLTFKVQILRLRHYYEHLFEQVVST